MINKFIQQAVITLSKRNNGTVIASSLSTTTKTIPNVLVNGLLQSQQHQRQQQLSSSFVTATSSVLSSATASTTTASVSEPPPMLGVGKYKTSTGIVGLPVEYDWYNVMILKFNQLLQLMEDSDMPVTAQYRINVTKWCNYCIKIIQDNPTNAEIVESQINLGQVEEIIEMIDDELLSSTCYIESRFWERVTFFETDISYNTDPNVDPLNTDTNEDGTSPNDTEDTSKNVKSSFKDAFAKKD